MQTRHHVLSGGILLLAGFWLSLIAPVARAQTEQGDFAAVWQRVQQAGAYSFHADVHQTRTPRATVANAGHHSRSSSFYMEGRTDLGTSALDLTLWSDGGSAMDTSSGLEIRVRDDTAEARKGSGAWEEIDNFTGLFAPGGDFMAYARAAKEIVQHPPDVRSTLLGEITVTRYTFAVDGRRFAQYMRAAMQEQAVQQGLPANITIGLPAVYTNMTGTGELWVGENGLPLRQSFSLRFPAAKDAYATATEIVVDFTEFAPMAASSSVPAAARFLHGHRSNTSTTVDAAANLSLHGSTIVFALLASAACLAFLRLRRRHWVHRSVVATVIVSMLSVPLMSSRQVYAFSADQATRAAAQEAEQAKFDARAALQAQMAAPATDPHTDVLARSRDQIALAQTSQVDEIPGELYAGRYLDPSCEDDPHGDMDGDTLTNLEECLLGTLPEEVDTDQDGVNDNVEVTGFQLPGSEIRWYTDPTQQDTNRDGIGDGREWYTDADGNQIPDDTDGDGQPDLWDDDNDGDQVPDDLDMSLYTQTARNAIFTADNPLRLTLTDLVTDELVTVEFQLKPTNPDHLWYSHNVLDWPVNDRRGQIQDADGLTFVDLDPTLSPSPNANGDMRMVPLLEIQFPINSPNLPPLGTCTNDAGETYTCYPLLAQFGISTHEISTDRLAAYVPLQLVGDGNGADNVAFYGRMLYQASGMWQTAHEVRMVWAIQMLNDICARFEDGICAEYESYNELQTIQTYGDEWYLTGLSTTEDHSADTALIYESPAALASNAAGDDAPLYLNALHGLLYGLDLTFLGARDCDTVAANGDCVPNGQRDITVAEIERRFDEGSNSGVSDEERWGLPNVFGVARNDYASGDLSLFDTTITQTVKLLDDVYANAWSAAKPITPTILFAGEETFRAINLDESIVGDNNLIWRGNALEINLAQAGDDAVPVETIATLKWTPYGYDPTMGWQPVAMDRFLPTLESEMAASFNVLSDPQEAATYETVSQALYMTVYNGRSVAVAIGNQILTEEYAAPDTSVQEALLRGTGDLFIIALQQFFTYAEELALAAQRVRDAPRYILTFNTPTKEFVSTQIARYGHSKVVAFGLLAFAAIAFLILLTVLVVKYATQSQWEGWDIIGASALLALTLVLGIIAPIFATIQAARATALAAGTVVTWGTYSKLLTTSAKVGSAAFKAALVGLIIAIAIALGIFIWAWASGAVSPGTVAFNTLIATTIASIIVAVIFFVLALTVIGALIVAFIVLVDTILLLAGVDFSITGMFTQLFATMIYRFSISEPIVTTGSLRAELLDEGLGYQAGNQIAYAMPITTSLYSLSPSFGSRALAGSMVYALNDHEQQLSTSTGARKDEWVIEPLTPGLPLSLWAARIEDTPQHAETLVAGPDSPIELYLNAGYALLGRECWLLFICKNRTVAGSISEAIGQIYVSDTLPASLDAFADVATWGRTPAQEDIGDIRFLDPDGDGLLAPRDGGVDPNNHKWDTDGDGLSDGYEFFVRSQPVLEGGAKLNPEAADTDGDGIPDGTELRLGTDPTKADSDADGLTDYDELAPTGGWMLPYRYDARTQQTVSTRIWSDPLQPDSDGDGMNDLFERTELTCSTCDPWANPANPLVYNPNLWNENPLAIYVANSTLDNVVTLNETFLYTTTTANGLSSGQRIVGDMELTLPNALTGGPLSAQVDIARGSRQSLGSQLTVMSSQSAVVDLTSQLDLTNYDRTIWSWARSPGGDLATIFGNVADIAVAHTAEKDGQYLAVTREIAANGAQAIVPYQILSDGTLFPIQSPQPFFIGGIGDVLSAPAVTCTADRCLAAWRVTRADDGRGSIYTGALRPGDATAVPGTVILADDAGGGAASAPAVATGGGQFMVAWSSSISENSTIWTRPVSVTGAPAGDARSVTATAPTTTSLALAWTGLAFRAVWTEDAMLRYAMIAGDGTAGTAQDLFPGRGWATGSNGERAPALTYDIASRQELIVYRQADNTGVLAARILNLAGPVGAEILLANDANLSQDDVIVALSADNVNSGWVLAWTVGGLGQINYRAVAPDGSLRGDIGSGAVAALNALALACRAGSSALVDLEFNDPPGSTLFVDSSENQRDASCSANCPESGIRSPQSLSVAFDAAQQQALQVNGVSFAGKSFTLAAWIAPYAGNLSGTIVSQGTLEHVNPGGAVNFYVSNGRVNCDLWQLNSTPNLSAPLGDNEWHHWACTFDEPTRRLALYRDGVTVNTSVLQGPSIYTGAGPLYIGKFATGNNLTPFGGYFTGALDQLSIYDRALAADELTASRLSCQLPLANGATALRSDSLRLIQSTTPVGDIGRQAVNQLTVDNDAPSVSISADFFSQSGDLGYVRAPDGLVIAGNATDPTSYATLVEIDPGTGMQPVDGTQSWAFTWMTTGRPDGVHSLTVRATDAGGNMSTPATWRTILDNTPPALTVTAPAAPIRPYRDETGNWRVPLSGTVTDPPAGSQPGSGVDSLAVLLQGDDDSAGFAWQSAAVDVTGAWALDYVLPEFANVDSPEAAGLYTITVRARDRISNATAVADYVTAPLQIDAYAPVVTPSLTLSNTALINTAFILEGTASDNRSVTAVEVNLTPGEQIGALDGAVLHLPFDERHPTGFFPDQSGAGHAAHCAQVACPATGVTGRRDRAVAFDGRMQSLAVDHNPAFNFGPDDDFTVAFWVNVAGEQVGAAPLIIGKGDGVAGNGYPFAVWYAPASGLITAGRADGTTNTAVVTTDPVNDGAFHHVAFIKQGNVLTLYIDGIQSGETVIDTTTGATDNASAITVAGSGAGTNHFAGALDELLIYDRALAAYELTNLVAYGLGVWAEAELDGDIWRYPIRAGSDGLEGIFQVNVRGTDALGNVTPQGGQRVWRGEIDTRPPDVRFTLSETVYDDITTSTYTCYGTDLNLDSRYGCKIRGSASPYRDSDQTFTAFSQVDPWYASIISDTARIYAVDASRTISRTVSNPNTLTAQVCDLFNRCTTHPVRLLPGKQDPTRSTLLAPSDHAVITSLAPITVTGTAVSEENLGGLQVGINDVTAYTKVWHPEPVTESDWSFVWTPPGEGIYQLQPVLFRWPDNYPLQSRSSRLDQGEEPASRSYLPLVRNGSLSTSYLPYVRTAVQPIGGIPGVTTLVYIDLTPPTVDIDPIDLSAAQKLSDRAVELSGPVADATLLHLVEVRIGDGAWDAAGIGADGRWRYPWAPAAGIDGATYTVSVRATDVAGRTTEVTRTVTVDIAPPTPGAVMVAYRKATGETVPMRPGTHVTDATTFVLMWDAAADAGGPVHYFAGFSPQLTDDAADLTAYSAPGVHTQPVTIGDRLYALVQSVDESNNVSIVQLGPFLVDSAR